VAGAGHGPFDYFAHEEYHTWLFAQSKTATVLVRNDAMPEQRRVTHRGLQAVFGTTAADGVWFDMTGKSFPAGIDQAKVRGSVRILMPGRGCRQPKQ
jgi:hypothetical protein